MLAGLVEQLGGAAHRLNREHLRDVAGKPLAHAGARQRVDDEREVRRARARDGGRGVLVALVDDDRPSDRREQRANQIDLLRRWPRCRR